MMARKIGVDRPPVPEIDELREDNGERLAMERLRYVVLKPGKTYQTGVTVCVCSIQEWGLTFEPKTPVLMTYLWGYC